MRVKQLSVRELELCRLVVADKPDKVIAAKMGWKQATVRTYLRTLFLRAGVDSRTGLAVWCLQNRLITFADVEAIKRKG